MKVADSKQLSLTLEIESVCYDNIFSCAQAFHNQDAALQYWCSTTSCQKYVVAELAHNYKLVHLHSTLHLPNN